MEVSKENLLILEQFDKPAFFANAAVVLAANSKAASIGIEADAELSDSFMRKQSKYLCAQTFSATFQGIEYTVSAAKIGEFTLYTLSANALTEQLQSIMRAAQQLRSPLAGLSGALDLIKQDHKDPIYGRTAKHLHALQRAVRNMSDAALFLEDRSSKKETVEIAGYFEETAEKLRQHFSDTDISISYSLFSEKLYCNMDISLIERAIYNMVSNSLKAGSKNLELDLKKNDGTLYLTITDDGCGMPNEQKASILTRFKEQPGWASQGYGLGLGMMIVFAAAKAHNGAMMIGDVTPHGCKITLTFAIEKDDTMVRQKAAGLRIDPLGGADPLLLELSDILPPTDYL